MTLLDEIFALSIKHSAANSAGIKETLNKFWKLVKYLVDCNPCKECIDETTRAVDTIIYQETESNSPPKVSGRNEQVIPWGEWRNRIAPHYPVAGLWRKPFELEAMLRIHMMQQWFGYSDPGMEEALHGVPMLREFAGLDAGEDVMPDETTILRFRHLLEKHHLAQSLFVETTAQLAKQGLLLRQGTIVDAPLIAALRHRPRTATQT